MYSKEFLNIKDTIEKKLIFNLPSNRLNANSKTINSNNDLKNKIINNANPAVNKLQKNQQKQNSTLTESSSGSNSLNKSSKTKTTRSSNNSISKKHSCSFKRQEKSIGRLCRTFESNKTNNKIHVIRKNLESSNNNNNGLSNIKSTTTKIEIPIQTKPKLIDVQFKNELERLFASPEARIKTKEKFSKQNNKSIIQEEQVSQSKFNHKQKSINIISKTIIVFVIALKIQT